MHLLPDLILLAAALAAAIFALLSWVRLRLLDQLPAALEKNLREELRQAREETARQAKELREEVASAQGKATETLVRTVNLLGANQKELLEGLTRTSQESGASLRGEMEKLVTSLRSEWAAQRDLITQKLQEILTSNEARFEWVRAALEEKLRGMAEDQRKHLAAVVATTEAKLEQGRITTDTRLQEAEAGQNRRGTELLGELQTRLEALKAEMAAQRDRIQEQLLQIQRTNEDRFDKVRRTLDEALKGMGDDQRQHLKEVIAVLDSLKMAQQEDQTRTRETLDQKFRQIQESNEQKLEAMRQTVDEKLHSTLEKRLGESFKLVSERLEAVQRGLGEMQNLATGVGDLKRVLVNVKERGTWGEYQLGAILAEILTPDQYAQNVRLQEGREVVEFAIRLPGRGADQDRPVWLPIDSKFPKEAYERLVEASRVADAGAVEAATQELARTILRMARDIQEKYLNPPATTDFAILFLPTEGLFAEVLRQPGLHDELQQRHRILVAGPTTLAAILNSLRVGFQTLAIEKRASEVWNVLGAVKTEFGKFGDVLDKVKKQISTVSNTLDESTRRTRAMERKLRDVEQLPASQADALLDLPPDRAPRGSPATAGAGSGHR